MRVLNSRIEIWVEILFLRHHVSIPIFQIELKLCCYDENVFRSNFSLFKIFPYLLYFSPSPLYSSFPNLHLLYSSFHHLYLVYIPPSPAFISFIFLLLPHSSPLYFSFHHFYLIYISPSPTFISFVILLPPPLSHLYFSFSHLHFLYIPPSIHFKGVNQGDERYGGVQGELMGV